MAEEPAKQDASPPVNASPSAPPVAGTLTEPTEASDPTQVATETDASRADPHEASDEQAPKPPPALKFTRTPPQRLLVLGLGILAPCLVIALSSYFIARGGAVRQSAPAQTEAPSSSPALPSSASALENGAGLESDPSAASDAAASGAVTLEGPGNPVVLAPGFEDEGMDEEPSPNKPSTPKHFATVQEAALGSCSTESVDGLSRQIIEQARCIKPKDFVALPKRPNLMMAPNVYPYLELSARDALLRVVDGHKKQPMTINSCLRTVAQQYLVSRWSLSKTCGVQLATHPGESNHEIGTALDIKEAGTWRPALEAEDFRWLGASDRVHFDYKGPSAGARSATDVLAFQKLWNRNHKDDPINETGRYDLATEQRLKKSPPSGFALGASCSRGGGH